MGILICGLNGCGKTTLGRLLADRLGYDYIDNEALFFPEIIPEKADLAAVSACQGMDRAAGTGGQGTDLTALPEGQETHLAYKYSRAKARSKEEVISLLEERIRDNKRFIFSAVKGDYGDRLARSLDYTVLIELSADLREQRLRERSLRLFGQRVLPGGDLYEQEAAWLSRVSSRPDDYVTEWIEESGLSCPLIKVDGRLPAEVIAADLAAGLVDL